MMRLSMRVGDVTCESIEFRAVLSDRIHRIETQRAEVRVQRVKWLPVVINIDGSIYEFMGDFLR